MKKRLAGLDMTELAETGAAAADRLTRLRERYAKTIKATGMHAE